ncbi:MFS transporter [Streptomyces scabichelini]|uniref:MFS transporter n=1 Tax=Streptomyces scabichelini TaxID=2711217 RepID=UPI0019D21118|nr:MFS transporter [Streptomyces scabichelini]
MATQEEVAASDGESAASARGWTLGVVCIATFMLMLDLTVVNVALPDMRVSLDADFSELQWVLDSYALTLAAFLLTGGSLADRLGRKRVFNIGFVVFTLASLWCGLSQSILQLNLARGLQGVGAAVLFAVGPALIGHEYRGKDRGRAFGIFGGVVGLAIAFGPLIGGALTDALNWRWIFLVNVPIGAAALIIGALRIRESRNPDSHPIDWAGLVVFSSALGLLVTGFLRGHAEGWGSAPIVSMFVGSGVLLVLFVVIERRRGSAAMLDLSMFRIPTFNGMSVATLLWNSTVLSAIFLQISYLQNVLGFSPLETGVRFLPMTLTLFVVAGVTGLLTARVSPKLLAVLSGTLMAVGLGLVTLVRDDSEWTVLLPSMLVAGVGMGIYQPLRAALSVGMVEPEKAGMSSGIAETFQQVGVALGIAVFGAVFQSRVADSFAASSVAGELGPRADQFGDAVATGAVGEMAEALPPDITVKVTEAAQSAFVDGLHDVLIASSAVTAVGAVIALLCIRSKDLHESARGDHLTDLDAEFRDLPELGLSPNAKD